VANKTHQIYFQLGRPKPTGGAYNASQAPYSDGDGIPLPISHPSVPIVHVQPTGWCVDYDGLIHLLFFFCCTGPLSGTLTVSLFIAAPRRVWGHSCCLKSNRSIMGRENACCPQLFEKVRPFAGFGYNGIDVGRPR